MAASFFFMTLQETKISDSEYTRTYILQKYMGVAEIRLHRNKNQ